MAGIARPTEEPVNGYYYANKPSIYKMNYRVCANFMAIIASVKIVSSGVI